MINVIDQFRTAMLNAGMDAPDVIYDDGVLHRFTTGDKRGKKNGWYFLHGGADAWGQAGIWHESGSDAMCHWSAKSSTTMTQAERDDHRQRVKAATAQRDADEVQRYEAAALKAERLLETSQPCTGNGYLSTKGAMGYGVRQDGQALLIPMRDTTGKLWNVERVNPADFKDKKGLYGGKRKGCYHAIGKPRGRIIVCEGYATGASIHEATGEAVAVAFNAGNLMAVTTALHKAYPELVLLLAADDDHQTEGNPGMSAAKSAALAVGGFVVVPQFPAGRPNKATDFNDLAALAGLDAVRACFSEIVGFVC